MPKPAGVLSLKDTTETYRVVERRATAGNIVLNVQRADASECVGKFDSKRPLLRRRDRDQTT
jgi:hypothetical protein